MKIILSLILTFICVYVFGQDSIVIDTIVTPPGAPPTGDVTIPLLSEWFQQGIGPAVSLAMIIIGYFSDRIPLLKKIDDVGLRVIGFAILVGAAYLVYPGMDVWKAAMSYVVSQLAYLLVLKPVGAGTKEVQAKLKS